MSSTVIFWPILGERVQNHSVQYRNGVISKRRKTSFDEFISLFDFHLFEDPAFVLFCVTDFVVWSGCYVPYFQLADRARWLNVSSHNASQLLSIIGITHTLGGVLMGFVSDWPCAIRLYVFNNCLIICGVGNLQMFQYFFTINKIQFQLKQF